MRAHDVGQVLMILAVGFLLGSLTSIAAYSDISGRRVESERQQIQDALRAAEEERDDANRRVEQYLDFENKRRDAEDQGALEQPAANPRGARVTPAARNP